MRPLFDCNLHFRFLQKATEAMFEMGQASVAATLACQKRFYDEMNPGNPRPDEPAPWASWFGDWTPVVRTPAPPAQPDLMQPWMAMANACSAYWGAAQMGQAPQASAMVRAMPASMQAFWGVTPWTVYQAPMVAMMVSYGVPYAVAAPTARASTSAMDAADAACEQWRLVFGSAEGQRSLDRNTSSASRRPTNYGYLH